MLNYDPFYHPLELPVQKLIAYCITNRPFFLPPREGSTPGTTIAGAFGTALWDAVCPYNDTPAGACNVIQTHKPYCHNPSACLVPWLYKPYSKVHRRNFARPVLLRAAELEDDKPVDNFTLEITLWGRHAIEALEAVKDTVIKMGELGLNRGEKQVHFEVTKFETAPGLTLAQRIENLPSVQSILLEFQTPFVHQEKDQQGKPYFHTTQDLPIIGILGNIAYNLVAWDIEDRELGEQLDCKARHGLARDARDVAWQAAEKLIVRRTHLSPVEMGERLSRSSQRFMSIQGFVGLAELGGDLQPALPWLLTLALAGGGQKRAMGFGTVKMWLDSTTTI